MHNVYNAVCCWSCKHKVVVRYNHHETIRCKLDNTQKHRNDVCYHYEVVKHHDK